MIKNIIFDLGNVILNIDTKQSEIEFAKHGIQNFESLYSLASQLKIFDELETGKLSPQDFYLKIRQFTNSHLDDETLKNCWNALILDFPAKRIELILSLQTKYRLFLLSNTNIIHYNYYNSIFVKEYGLKSFNSLFEKAYYSHEIGFRKPDLRAFETILQNSKIKAEETLFIDDNKANIETAKTLGLHTLWLRNNNLEQIDLECYIEKNYKV